MKIVTSLDRWIVTLRSGACVSVWGDGFSEVEGEYVFSVLVDREPDEQGLAEAEVAARTPSDPARVDIVTVRIPMSEVVEVRSA